MPKEISAGAVIFREEDGIRYYLLLHYEVGHWDFPKGHVEEGENDEETVRREVEEETGIKDLEIIEGFREYIKYAFRNSYESKEVKKGEWIIKVVNFYLAKTKTKNIKLSFEHIGYKWLSYEDSLNQLSFKNAKDILEKADKRLSD